MATTLTAGTTIAATLLVIGAIMVVGYQIQNQTTTATPSPTEIMTSVSPTPTVEVTVTPSVSLSPTPTSQTRSSSSTTVTQRQNQQSSQVSISQRTTPATPTTTPRPTRQTTNETRRIVFVDTPTSVRSGQSFTVTWRIEGPEGERGEQTTIKTHYAVSKSSGGSQSSTTSDNTNSFGSFTVPATYSTNLSYGGDEGTIEVTVTAEVNGQTLTAQRDIRLTN